MSLLQCENLSYTAALLYVMTSTAIKGGQSYFGLAPLPMMKLFSENKVILVQPVFRSTTALEFVGAY